MEKVYNPLVDVEMVKLGNHRLLVFQIFVKLVDQSVALIDYRADVIKYLGVGVFLEFC